MSVSSPIRVSEVCSPSLTLLYHCCADATGLISRYVSLTGDPYGEDYLLLSILVADVWDDVAV